MSIPNGGFPPIPTQDAYIEANMNAILMFSFLMGMYTLVYFGTLRLYYSRNGPAVQRRIVVPTITILYLMCTGTFASNWYLLKYAVIDNGRTDTSRFNALVYPTRWVYIALVTLQFGIFIISDGLLIWRCYHVWDRSIRVILVPLIFLVAEIGVSVAIVVATVPNSQFITDPTLADSDTVLVCAGLFTTFATTVTTTFLIGYRIYSATRPVEGTIITRGSRFQHITKVLSQSAAAYAVIVFVNTIFGVKPYTLASKLDLANTYISFLLPIAAGMAPTMVVARIAMAGQDTTQDSVPFHISDLHFQTQPNLGDEADIESRLRSQGVSSHPEV